MTDIEIHVSLDGQDHAVGLARRNLARGSETVVFEYADAWPRNPSGFALEPGLPLMRKGMGDDDSLSIKRLSGHDVEGIALKRHVPRGALRRLRSIRL